MQMYLANTRDVRALQTGDKILSVPITGSDARQNIRGGGGKQIAQCRAFFAEFVFVCRILLLYRLRTAYRMASGDLRSVSKKQTSALYLVCPAAAAVAHCRGFACEVRLRPRRTPRGTFASVVYICVYRAESPESEQTGAPLPCAVCR